MKRSKHSLSHYKLLTCDGGELVPCGLVEVLPGDSLQQATSVLVRQSPLLAPVMHPVHCRVHHWFVPFRLIWDDWEDFITGGPDGDDDSVFPIMENKSISQGGLDDYMGVPPGTGRTFSALPRRAYALIWNEWYRDQDLQTAVTISKASGVDTTTPGSIQYVAWEKDYFTSARPWPQKGPEITLPLGTTAPILNDGVMAFAENAAGTVGAGNLRRSNTSDIAGFTTTGSANTPVYYKSGLEADLSGATAASVNALREAFALQRFAEARARYGSRYTEYLRYLGVRSSDARLQRPEYLGGGKQTLQISEVLQTSPTTDGDDEVGVGNLKGHGIGALRSNRYRRFFEEHGYVVSLLSIKPKTMYVQGMPRTYNRRTREDFFQKELQHIGQQEVLNKELYYDHASPDGIFGYQDRYDEYRRMESTIAGEFRNELDFWHYARIFNTDPALNADFVKANPTKRVNAVETNDVFWCMVNHSIQARRLVSRVGSSFTY